MQAKESAPGDASHRGGYLNMRRNIANARVATTSRAYTNPESRNGKDENRARPIAGH